MKQLTLKIALGVFSGAIAVLLVLNTSSWIRKIPGWVQRQRWHATNDDAMYAMNSITPDRVIKRCGQPTIDRTNNPTSVGTERFFYYKDQNVTLHFERGPYDSDWKSAVFKMYTGEPYAVPSQHEHLTMVFWNKGNVTLDFQRKEVVEALPCLGTKLTGHINIMTPDIVIQHCGRPTIDKSNLDWYISRVLYFKDQNVTLGFERDRLNVIHMSRGKPDLQTPNGILKEDSKHSEAFNQIAALPCLGNLKKEEAAGFQ